MRLNDVVQFESALPMYEKKWEFKQKIDRFECIILRATTGSGKTTQIPQYLLECSKHGRIVVTEPRAIAAESTAKRIQNELIQCGSSDLVGYIVGPSIILNSETRIVFMTEVTPLVNK